jgi:hypothetical protein
VGTKETSERLRQRESVGAAPVDVDALNAWDGPEEQIHVVVRTHAQAAMPGAQEALFRAFAGDT